MTEQEDKSREYWDRQAASAPTAECAGLLSEDERLSTYRDTAEKAVLLARHGQRLQFAVGTRVLEVGCGGGRWTSWLAKRGAHVVAADISANMIELARKHLEHEGVRGVELIVASMDELKGLPPFDLIYLGSCLHYMSDEAVESGIANVAAMLRPGGTLLTRDTVSLIGRAFHRSEKFGGNDPAIYRPRAYYQAHFERHGLALRDEWPTYVLPLAWRFRSVLPSRWVDAGMQAELRRAATEVQLAWILRRPGIKEHRFYVYEHATAGA